MGDSTIISGIRSLLQSQARPEADQATAAAATPSATQPLPAVSAALHRPGKSTPYRKGAGEWVPPGTSIGPIAMDDQEQNTATGNHPETSPAAETVSAAPAQAAKKPITLDAIVAEYRKSLRLTTHRHLFVGGLIHSWITRQPERSEQLPRAAAIIVIEQRIEREGLAGVCRPHRDLKCFHAARLLGGDADGLAISAIYQILRLVERAAGSDHWQLIPDHAEAARALWARMLEKRLTAEAVRSEVARILPVPAARHKRPYSRQAATVLRLVWQLSPEELAEVARTVKEARAKAVEPHPAAA
jgi:hypothetical protein